MPRVDINSNLTLSEEELKKLDHYGYDLVKDLNNLTNIDKEIIDDLKEIVNIQPAFVLSDELKSGLLNLSGKFFLFNN